MKVSVSMLVLVFCFSCGHKPHHTGKWYSYSDDGDYQEIWIGEGKALSYLTKVDKLFLYEYTVSGDSLKFNLIESDLIDSHEFILRIKGLEEEVMITEFIGGLKTDTLKSYFRIAEGDVVLGDKLEDNLKYRDEIIGREAAGGQSHEGHNH